MKTFQLEGTPRTDLGKKAVKALRKNGLIPAVLNGGEVFNLPYTGKLNEGEKVVEIGNNQALIVTDFTVTTNDVRKLVYTPDIRRRTDHRQKESNGCHQRHTIPPCGGKNPSHGLP